MDMIPVGNRHEHQKMFDRHTLGQRMAVEAIIASDDFDFACMNPFDEDVDKGYTGPFTFVYMEFGHILHAIRFSPSGDEEQHVVVS